MKQTNNKKFDLLLLRLFLEISHFDREPTFTTVCVKRALPAPEPGIRSDDMLNLHTGSWSEGWLAAIHGTGCALGELPWAFAAAHWVA